MKTIIAAFWDAETADRGAGILKSRIDDGSQVRTFRFEDMKPNALEKLRGYNLEDRLAQRYAEVLRRGGCVLVGHVPDNIANDLADDLDNIGALDLESAETRWRKDGWTGFDASAARYDAAAGAREREAHMRGEAPADLEVVQEKVKVGKREVPRGGVRIRSFITERPIHQDVQLREERIDVRREKVDEPAAAGAMDSTLEEGEIEVTATGEEVVVGKEARVVERVHVGKTEETRTESVDETERRREVEVEQTGGEPKHP